MSENESPVTVKKTNRRKFKLFQPLTFLILILIFWVPLYAFYYFNKGGVVTEDNYQAVFLTNGQVYFGKLEGLHTDFPVLTDIYYLIVTRPLQGQSEATDSAQQQPDFSLRKLGGELHGPVDKMVINKRHILFVEDLRDDGQVVQSIRAQGAAPATQSPEGN